mgnify:CR=1 FL=1
MTTTDIGYTWPMTKQERIDELKAEIAAMESKRPLSIQDVARIAQLCAEMQAVVAHIGTNNCVPISINTRT